MRDGYVYFAQRGKSGPIKIGFSESVETRLASLQTASHETLHLIGMVKGTKATETSIHNALAADRLRGEWFAPTELVLETMRNRIENQDEAGANVVSADHQLFRLKVRLGDEEAWLKVKRAIRETSSLNVAASALGISKRCLMYWLSDVDGLREFAEGGK